MHCTFIILIILVTLSTHCVICSRLKRFYVSPRNKEALQTNVRLKGIVEIPSFYLEQLEKGSIQIALDYCKNKAILLKRPLASRHCIKIWNNNYKKYCATSTRHIAPKCKRLRNKASKLHEHILRIKLRGNSNLSSNNTRAICGERTISLIKYGCCSDERYRLATHGCCGKIVYRKDKTTCCNLQVHDKDGINKTRCCGKELIDVALFFCLNGTIKNKYSVSVTENHTINPKNIRPAIQHTVIVVLTSSSLAVLLILIGLSFVFCSSFVKFFSRKYQSVPLNRTEYCSMPSTLESLSIGNSKGVVKIDEASGIQARESNIENMSKLDTDDECITADQISLTNGLDNGIDGVELLNNETSFSGHMSIRDTETRIIRRENYFQSLKPSSYSKDFDDKALLKDPDSNVKNVHVSHVDTGVQTSSEKAFNVLNSMGKPFDHSFVFNTNNKTLQLPNSAVTFTLSDDDVKEEKRCLASTHRNVAEIRNKLGLNDTELVASPAVEYCFINGQLKDLATVKMPFVGDPSKLVVLKVKSDQGMETDVEKTEIKRKDVLGADVYDECYEIIGPGQIAVYVRRMSWLVCKYCGHNHPNFNLNARLYGRLDADPEMPYVHEISLSLYLIDEIYSIPDYEQNLKECESNRSRLLWRKILLPGEVSMSDKIQVSLTLEHPRREWKHRTNANNQVISAEKMDMLVDNITGCHAQRNPYGLPFAKDWQLVSTSRIAGNVPKLRCIVTIAHISGSTGVLSHEDPHYIETRPMHEAFEKRNQEKKNNPLTNLPEHLVGNNIVSHPTSHIQQPESCLSLNARQSRREPEQGVIPRAYQPEIDPDQASGCLIQQPQESSDNGAHVQLAIGSHRESLEHPMNRIQSAAGRPRNLERPQSDGSQNDRVPGGNNGVRGEINRQSI